MDSVHLTCEAVAALLSENFVLVSCAGIGTRTRAFSDPREARRTGTSVMLVMILTVLFTWLVDVFVMAHLLCEHFRLLIFTLITLGVVSGLRLFFKLFLPALSDRLDDSMASLSTNGSALGAALMVSVRGYELGQALTFAFFGGLGVLLVLLSFSGLRDSVHFHACPTPFRGIPITLITAALMALALFGFYGLHIG